MRRLPHGKIACPPKYFYWLINNSELLLSENYFGKIFPLKSVHHIDIEKCHVHRNIFIGSLVREWSTNDFERNWVHHCRIHHVHHKIVGRGLLQRSTCARETKVKYKSDTIFSKFLEIFLNLEHRINRSLQCYTLHGYPLEGQGCLY